MGRDSHRKKDGKRGEFVRTSITGETSDSSVGCVRGSRRRKRSGRRRRRHSSSESSDSSGSSDGGGRCDSSGRRTRHRNKTQRSKRRKHNRRQGDDPSAAKVQSLQDKHAPAANGTSAISPGVDSVVSLSVCECQLMVNKHVEALLTLDDTAVQALNLLAVKLDDNEGVSLESVENTQLRKKLRHLFYALELSVEGEGSLRTYTKSESFKDSGISVKGVIATAMKTKAVQNVRRLTHSHQIPETTDKMPPPEEELKMAADLVTIDTTGNEVEAHEVATRVKPRKGPAVIPTKSLAAQAALGGSGTEFGPALPGADAEEGGVPAGDTRREAWMTSAHPSLMAAFGQKPAVEFTVDPRKKLLYEEEQKRMADIMEELRTLQEGHKNLAEIHQQNLSKGQQPDLSKWQRTEDSWGVSQAQQSFTASSSSRAASSSEGEPWRRFDPERDLQTRGRLPTADCERLMERARDMQSRFGGSSYLSNVM